MNFTDLAENVKRFRKEKGLTQENLAELSEMSVAYLSKIENDRANNVSILMVYRLATALKVTPACLLGKSDTNELLDELIMKRVSDCSTSDKKKLLKIIDILSEKED